MLKFAFIVTFLICIATAIYGFLISSELRSKSTESRISQKLYIHQILVYVFGFYGIWGYVISKELFGSQILNSSILERVSISITSWAIPFLLASWIFLIQLSNALLQIHRKGLNLAIILLITAVSISSVIYLNIESPTILISTKVFVIFNGLISLYLIIGVINSKIIKVEKKNKNLFLFVFILIEVLLIVSANFLNTQVLFTIAFILFFFISNAWIAFSFNYFVEFPHVYPKDETLSFAQFCEKFGISNRESEIIKLICKGYTNKEIAEELFITLQTVKDHTSRIYLKTEVKNRTQLANRVREYE